MYVKKEVMNEGPSTPYKRWSRCTMEKVRGDKVFTAFFRNLGGDNISYL